MKARDINPDADISVAAVFPGGVAKVYGPTDETTGIRPYQTTRRFPNYGTAALWASEYTQRMRDSRPVRHR